MPRTDVRLRIITDVLRGLIPGANPLHMQVLVEETLPDQPGAHNAWVGPIHAVAEKVHTALYGAPVDPASPLERSGAAKRRRDLPGEIDALMGGQRALESAPWYPARPGDVVHVAYDAIPPHFPAHGETYIVERPDGDGWFGLRLLTHTRPASMGAPGDFAVDDDPDPLFTPWMEAGPHSLTIVRDGRVVHPGGVR